MNKSRQAFTIIKGQQTDVIAGEIFTMGFQMVKELLVHLAKCLPELIPVLVVVQIEVYPLDQLPQLLLQPLLPQLTVLQLGLHQLPLYLTTDILHK